MKRPNLTGFAEACFDHNTIEDLISCLERGEPDQADTVTWTLRGNEWRQAIGAALRAKIVDLENRTGSP